MKRRIVELTFKSGELSFSQIRNSISFEVKDRQIENYLRELVLLGVIEYNDMARKYFPSILWSRLDESILNLFSHSIRTLKSRGHPAAFMSEVASIAGLDPTSHANELFAAAKKESFRIQISGEPAIIYRKFG